MALSPREMHDRIIENLAEKTGYAFDHWQSVVKAERGEKDDKAVVAHLKAAHGLGHYTAVAIIKEAGTGNDYDAKDDLVAALFAEKPDAKRLYDALDAEVMALPDTERVPCKTYVGYRAKTQFLIVAPSGDDTLRCGLAMSPSEAGLEPSSNFGSARIASRFDLTGDALSSTQRDLIAAAHKRNR